jgi:hypothetical protein
VYLSMALKVRSTQPAESEDENLRHVFFYASPEKLVGPATGAPDNRALCASLDGELVRGEQVLVSAVTAVAHTISLLH